MNIKDTQGRRPEAAGRTLKHLLITALALVAVLGTSMTASAKDLEPVSSAPREFPANVRPAAAAGYHPAVAGHRGSCGYLPEHTLAGMAYAYAVGADYIEQDVVVTKDDVLVVLHDHTLETTTDVARKFPGRNRPDGSYYAIDFTYPEIRSLVVTERFDPTTGKAVFPGRFPVDSGIEFRVPTLREALELIRGLNKSTGQYRMPYVEVKEPAAFEREGKHAMQATIDMLTEYGWNSMESGAILQCFDYEATRDSRSKGWKGELCMLVDAGGQRLTDDRARQRWMLTPEGIKDVSRFATIYAPGFSNLVEPAADGKGFKSTGLCEYAHKCGMKVHTWTLRRDAPVKGFTSFDQMLDVAFKLLKLDGAFSDFPGEVLLYLKREGLR